MRYGGGFSANICVRGVFVVGSQSPPEETPITVTVLFPYLASISRELHLQSVGTVVRVQKSDRAAGYAIECDFSGIDDFVK